MSDLCNKLKSNFYTLSGLKRENTIRARVHEELIIVIVFKKKRQVGVDLWECHEVERSQVAEALRSILAFRAIRVVDAALLYCTVELYELERLDFADAYLIATAERTGVGVVASFDRGIDRVGTIKREEPS